MPDSTSLQHADNPVRCVLGRASNLADSRRDAEITSLHVTYAAVEQEPVIAAAFLAAGVSLDRLHDCLESNRHTRNRGERFSTAAAVEDALGRCAATKAPFGVAQLLDALLAADTALAHVITHSGADVVALRDGIMSMGALESKPQPSALTARGSGPKAALQQRRTSERRLRRLRG